jgi:peroxiredoxin
MHEQAQLRLKKSEVEDLGAEAFVVLAMDTFHAMAFKEENRLLSGGKGKFSKEESLVYATPLCDPAGYAGAVYGVSRKCLRWQSWVENDPCWFVIDRKGILTYAAHPTFATPTSYVDDVDQMLKALKEAAR